MNALPHAIAGRRDASNDAERLADRVDVDARAGTVGEFALHQMRNARCELAHFEATLDVALGVGNGLAVLARQRIGKLVHVAVQQVDEAREDAGAALRIGRRPRRLRTTRVLDGLVDLGDRRERHARRNLARHRPEYIAKPTAGAADLLAADEMGEFLRHVPHVPLKVDLRPRSRARKFADTLGAGSRGGKRMAAITMRHSGVDARRHLPVGSTPPCGSGGWRRDRRPRPARPASRCHRGWRNRPRRSCAGCGA